MRGPVKWSLVNGAWVAEDGELAATHVHVDYVDRGSGLWTQAEGVALARRVAVAAMEEGMAKGQLRSTGYRLRAGRAPESMTPENKEKLKEASRKRREEKAREKGLSEQGGVKNKKQGEEDMNAETGTATEGKAKKAKKAKKEKKDKKAYLATSYMAVEAKLDTEKGKKLMDAKNESQAAMALRFVAKKAGALFSEVLEHMKKELNSKPNVVTIERNLRWYLGDLRKKGFIKSVTDKVEATSQGEALGN